MSLFQHVQRAIMLAELGISKLHSDIYYLNSMSSPKVKRLLNSLCELENGIYMEIGMWRGVSLISALYQNQNYIKNAIAIDNFSEFEKPLFVNSLNFEGSPVKHPTIKFSFDPVPLEFKKNIDEWLGKVWDDKLDIYNEDCFAVSLLEELKIKYSNSVNIYFYDGAHDQQSQYDGIVKYDPLFTDEFILVVDDWTNNNAKEGTLRAINDMKYNVKGSWELPANFNGDVWNYWAGLGLFVISKY